jgi:signal peptidase I
MQEKFSKKTITNIIFAVFFFAVLLIGNAINKTNIGDSMTVTILESGVLLGTIITWIGFNLKSNKSDEGKNTFMESETFSFIWELTKTIVGVVLFVIIFRFFVLQPFYVIGSSMEPSFENGDYLFVDEFTYHFRGPQRGEVVVFRHPEDTCTAYIDRSPVIRNVFEGPCKSYIKRVIGLPGETVKIKDGKVTIINKSNPNGFLLDEKYIQTGVATLGNQSVSLGKNEYFVLGDNRLPNASSDSREWGPLTPKYIVGKVFVRLLPTNEAGFIQTAKY